MNKKRNFLIGGSSKGFEEKRKGVTSEELRRVMGRSGASIDPNGRNILISPPDPTRP